MLEINLIPPHLRKRKKKDNPFAGLHVPLEIVIGLGAAVFGALILINFFFFYLRFTKLAQYKNVQKQWESIRPDKEDVDHIVSELRVLQGQLKSIKEMTGDQQLHWAQKLNGVSDHLPRGVWLKKIAVKDGMFFIEGSAISKQKDEMISVHQFISMLKKEQKFLEHLTDVELGSVQRRHIHEVEITDFLITSKIK